MVSIQIKPTYVGLRAQFQKCLKRNTSLRTSIDQTLATKKGLRGNSALLEDLLESLTVNS